MKGAPIIVVLLGIIAVIVLLCTHTVKEWEQALILEFGQAKRVENAWGATPEAGLKFKLPYEKVVTLDRRNLEVDLSPVELVASDQERLVVDAFVRYRIVDGVKFYQALQTERGEIIRGQGDQERNAIYAEAYNQDPEFFAFYRSMEAYQKGLGVGTTYVLSPDSDFLGYLSNQSGPRR